MAKELMIVDNKKKIELTITGIGVIILIFLIANYMPKLKDNKFVSRAEPRPTLPAIVSSTGMPAIVSVAGEVGYENDVKWGRDPFLLDTSNAKEQGMEDLVLNGVVSDKLSPYAIINNDVVKIGDKVSGMTVIEINEKNVVLDENGQRRTLELNVY